MISEISAPAVLIVLPSTTRPFSCFSKSGRSVAIRSTTFNSSAFSALIEALYSGAQTIVQDAQITYESGETGTISRTLSIRTVD